MTDLEYGLVRIALYILVIGLLGTIGWLTYLIPVYMVSYLLVVTILFMAMDIQEDKKDIEHYAIMAVVWIFAPFFFWYSL